MAEEQALRPLRPCPICRRLAVAEFRPFCSARCRTVDMGRWLTETYVVPGKPAETEED